MYRAQSLVEDEGSGGLKVRGMWVLCRMQIRDSAGCAKLVV